MSAMQVCVCMHAIASLNVCVCEHGSDLASVCVCVCMLAYVCRPIPLCGSASGFFPYQCVRACVSLCMHLDMVPSSVWVNLCCCHITSARTRVADLIVVAAEATSSNEPHCPRRHELLQRGVPCPRAFSECSGEQQRTSCDIVDVGMTLIERSRQSPVI